MTLIRGRGLVEDGAYFDLSVKLGGTYKNASLILGLALVRGNIVVNNSVSINKTSVWERSSCHNNVL